MTLETQAKEFAVNMALETETRVSSLIDEFNEAYINEEPDKLEDIFTRVEERTDSLVIQSQLDGMELGVHLELASLMFKVLPATSKKVQEYKYTFDKYADAKSGGRTKSARDNLMRAARVFVMNRQKLSIPNGIEFNPWLVSPSNLVVAAHRAETGKLSKEAWRKLADPKTKQRELIQQLHDDEPKEVKPPMSDERVLYERDGVIYFVDTVVGDTVGVGSVEIDDPDASVQRGIALLRIVIKNATTDNVSKLLKENAV